MNAEERNQIRDTYSCLGETIAEKLTALEEKRRMARNAIWAVVAISIVAFILLIIIKGKGVHGSFFYSIAGLLSIPPYFLRKYMRTIYKKELPQLVVESISPELRIENSVCMLGKDNVPVEMIIDHFSVGSGNDTVYDDCVCFRRDKAGVRKRGYILELGNGETNTLWTMPMNGVVRSEQIGETESGQTDNENETQLLSEQDYRDLCEKILYVGENYKIVSKLQLAYIVLPSGENLLLRMETLREELVDMGYIDKQDKLRIGINGDDLFICIPTSHDLFEGTENEITVGDMLIEQRFLNAYLSLYNDLNPERKDESESKPKRSTLRVGSYDAHSSSSSVEGVFSMPLVSLIVIVLCIFGYLTYSGNSLNVIMLHHYSAESISEMRECLEKKEYNKCEEIGKKFLEDIASVNGHGSKATEETLALSVEANQLMVELYSHKKDSLSMFKHYRMAIDSEKERIGVIGKDDYDSFDGYIVMGEMYVAMGSAYETYNKRQEARRLYGLAIMAFEKADSVIPPYDKEKRKAPFIRNRNKCYEALVQANNLMAYSYAYDRDYEKAHQFIDKAISCASWNALIRSGRFYDSKGEFFLMQYKDKADDNDLDSAYYYWTEAHINDFLFDDYVKEKGGTNLSRGLEELGIDLNYYKYYDFGE